MSESGLKANYYLSLICKDDYGNGRTSVASLLVNLLAERGDEDDVADDMTDDGAIGSTGGSSAAASINKPVYYLMTIGASGVDTSKFYLTKRKANRAGRKSGLASTSISLASSRFKIEDKELARLFTVGQNGLFEARLSQLTPSQANYMNRRAYLVTLVKEEQRKQRKQRIMPSSGGNKLSILYSFSKFLTRVNCPRVPAFTTAANPCEFAIDTAQFGPGIKIVKSNKNKNRHLSTLSLLSTARSKQVLFERQKWRRLGK